MDISKEFEEYGEKKIKILISIFHQYMLELEQIPMLILLFRESGEMIFGGPSVYQKLTSRYESAILNQETFNFIENAQHNCFYFIDEIRHLEYASSIVGVLHDLTSNSSKEEFVWTFDKTINLLIEEEVRSGMSVTPDEILQFIVSILNINSDAKIYNPFAGTGKLNLYLPEGVVVESQEASQKYWQYGVLRLLVRGNKNLKFFENINPIEEFHRWSDPNTKYDAIISDPPFGSLQNTYHQDSKTYAEFIIRNSLKYLDQKSTLAFITNTSFLSSNSRSDKILRRDLLDKGLISSVILLPSNLYANTNIPVVLVVLDGNHKGDQVCMLDASSGFDSRLKRKKILSWKKLYNAYSGKSEHKAIVEADRIRRNDFSLVPSRYLSPDFKGIELGKIVSIIKAKKPLANIETGFNIRTKELQKNGSLSGLDLSTVKPSVIKTNARLIDEDCLLVSLFAADLKPTIFKFSGEPIFIWGDVVALRIRTINISYEYLFIALREETIKPQLEWLQRGVVIHRVNRKDLLRLKVEIPKTPAQQLEIINLRQVLENQAKDLGETTDKRILEILSKQKDNLSIKKHNISQYLNNVKLSLESLSYVMNSNNGTLNSEHVINPITGVTVAERFRRMKNSLDDAIFYTDHIIDEIAYKPAEQLDLNELIEENIRSYPSSGKFRFEFNYDETAFSEYIILPIVSFSKRNFKELFTNIVENAEDHGFPGNDRDNVIKIELSIYNADNIMLIISNNGKPFPKGMSERYSMKGEKAGPTGKNGLGSWIVTETLQHYGATLEVIDKPEDDFPVQLIMKFPI